MLDERLERVHDDQSVADRGGVVVVAAAGGSTRSAKICLQRTREDNENGRLIGTSIFIGSEQRIKDKYFMT